MLRLERLIFLYKSIENRLELDASRVTHLFESRSVVMGFHHLFNEKAEEQKNTQPLNLPARY